MPRVHLLAVPLGDENELRSIARQMFWPMHGNGNIDSLIVTLGSWSKDYENILTLVFLVVCDNVQQKNDLVAHLSKDAKVAHCLRSRPTIIVNVSINEFRSLTLKLCSEVTGHDLRLAGNQMFMLGKMMKLKLFDGFTDVKLEDNTFILEAK